MKLTVIRDESDGTRPPEPGVLRSVLSMHPLSDVILSGASHPCGSVDANGGSRAGRGTMEPFDAVWEVAVSWPQDLVASFERDTSRVLGNRFDVCQLSNACLQPWFLISNGRFAVHITGRLSTWLAQTSIDGMAVMVAPGLLAYREHIRLTAKGELVGYRRLYQDSIEPTPMPADWPHHFFLRSEHVEAVLSQGLPHTFDEMMERCRLRGLKVEAVSVAGSVIDLASPEGLLTLSDAVLTYCPPRGAVLNQSFGRHVYVHGTDQKISPYARFVGPILLGSGVRVEPDAVVVGPSILCDRCTVRRGALVDSSILGTETDVESESFVDHCLIMGARGTSSSQCTRALGAVQPWIRGAWSPQRSAFRMWPRFSYVRCFKRIADVVVASIVLILFAPIVPIIALAIKVNSPGPVFFKDKRQGLHGRLFDCIKFRTMRVGAAEIQDKLRFVSEVDGPQFKMADDPRISTVGRFLRETYLDEIPQFFNVLCGQMSVVGPRPSPESENTFCPSWRDARLSVRPGITGLWQVCRTREPFKDFQEWIYFDTKYVQELSPRMDVWVCWRTFRKMLDNFIRQF